MFIFIYNFILEFMSLSRPSIEKWNRSDLEDKYHFLLEQNLMLKKQINYKDERLRT